jgi:hypothetical protein
MRALRIFGGILLLVLLQRPALALPDAYSIPLSWDASSSLAVVGYRVYYGTTSGNYETSIVVGNVTSNTVSGLASGVTYFFAVTAYTAAGLESAFSSEISVVPGLPTLQIRVLATGPTILNVRGLIGHTYDIQGTSDLKTWAVIGTVTVGVGGSVSFTNSNAGNFARRFYRTRDTQP